MLLELSVRGWKVVNPINRSSLNKVFENFKLNLPMEMEPDQRRETASIRTSNVSSGWRGSALNTNPFSKSLSSRLAAFPLSSSVIALP